LIAVGDDLADLLSSGECFVIDHVVLGGGDVGDRLR